MSMNSFLVKSFDHFPLSLPPSVFFLIIIVLNDNGLSKIEEKMTLYGYLHEIHTADNEPHIIT